MEGKPDRISRRRMLKRVGAGAAIAWSAPVLSSLRTPAFAQLYPECADCPEVCPQGACGRPDQGCSCLLTVRDDCFCHDIVFCSTVTPCTADADCPDTWRCAFSCCDPTAAQAFCHPPCGAGIDAAAQAGGAGTSAG